MTEQGEIYKCSVCGNIVEVVHASGGTMSCCGKPMVKQTENTTEASKEKHIPVIERTANGVLVKVGSVPHPMEEKHYIEWIEVIADGKVMRTYLKPGARPEAEFVCTAQNVVARAYCNIHGLWRSGMA